MIDEGNRGIMCANLVENKDAPDGVDLGSDARWKNEATKEKEPTHQGSSATFAVLRHLHRELA